MSGSAISNVWALSVHAVEKKGPVNAAHYGARSKHGLFQDHGSEE